MISGWCGSTGTGVGFYLFFYFFEEGIFSHSSAEKSNYHIVELCEFHGLNRKVPPKKRGKKDKRKNGVREARTLDLRITHSRML